MEGNKMSILSIRKVVVSVFLIIFSSTIYAEKMSRNGYSAPVRDTVRVLLIFAEVDYSGGGCPKNYRAPPLNDEWGVENGITQIPGDVDILFDSDLPNSGTPNTFITSYYFDASMGNYIVLGDYYPKVVVVDCVNLTKSPTNHANAVIGKLNTINSDVTTASGKTLADFDLYSWDQNQTGELKNTGSNGAIDIMFIIWRNNQYMDSPLTGSNNELIQARCNAGYGLTNTSTDGLKDMKGGVQLISSFNGCYGAESAIEITLAEYLHGIFGGNNWHTGAGKGAHTFFAPIGSFSITAQSGSASNIVSGWDRWFLEWEHPDKNSADMEYITVGDQTIGEVVSDISIESHPSGATFTLRDFVTTGDVIRIKLPHIDWINPGDLKNQYLWLENHQRFSCFDFSGYFNGNDDPVCQEKLRLKTLNECDEKWSKGIYAYIQVGKDKKVGSDIYSASASKPNGLANWLFPLTAEGNFDFFYLLKEVLPANGAPCQWDNISIPIDKTLSLPNPFTGYSDVFQMIDSNYIDTQSPSNNTNTLLPGQDTGAGNGVLFSGDLKYILSEFIDGKVENYLPGFGDSEDAFRCDPGGCGMGKTILSLSTNPAPTPVYTLKTNIGYPSSGPLETFENRTIWLNGLAIEILEENVDSNGAVTIHVSWDNYRLNNDVRWTGNIILKNNEKDPNTRQSKIIISEGNNLYLDRGLSPIKHRANSEIETIFPFGLNTIYPPGLSPESSRLFTDPTKLVLKRGTKLHLEKNATLWVQNKSTLLVEVGAEVVLEPGAEILTGSGGGTILIHQGDLNADSCVDRTDFVIIFTQIRNRSPYDPEFDLNRDDEVNMVDARKLVTLFTNTGGVSCS
jgi:hypothetical protein